MHNARRVSQWINDNSIKGFLADDEGEALFNLASRVGRLGPGLEIGSYCGKSTIYLAAGFVAHNTVIYAVDHHCGSEEHQYGEAYHDVQLFDAEQKRMNSFPTFEQNINRSGLASQVVPIISSSKKLVQHWQSSLSMVFIDGGHSPEMAMEDCMQWSKKIAVGGVLAVHDIFEHPEDGGQGPFLALRAVLEAGQFVLEEKINSLAFARKI